MDKNRFEVHNIKGKTFVTPDGVIEYDEDAFAIWDKNEKGYVSTFGVLPTSSSTDECARQFAKLQLPVLKVKYLLPETKSQKRNRLVKEALAQYGWTQSKLFSAIKDGKLELPMYDEVKHG